MLRIRRTLLSCHMTRSITISPKSEHRAESLAACFQPDTNQLATSRAGIFVCGSRSSIAQLRYLSKILQSRFQEWDPSNNPSAMAFSKPAEIRKPFDSVRTTFLFHSRLLLVPGGLQSNNNPSFPPQDQAETPSQT